VGVATESTFGNKFLEKNLLIEKKHCHRPWFDVDYHITKHELRLWLKAKPIHMPLNIRKINF
jgi:hypothetical protein